MLIFMSVCPFESAPTFLIASSAYDFNALTTIYLIFICLNHLPIYSGAAVSKIHLSTSRTFTATLKVKRKEVLLDVFVACADCSSKIDRLKGSFIVISESYFILEHFFKVSERNIIK